MPGQRTLRTPRTIALYVLAGSLAGTGNGAAQSLAAADKPSSTNELGQPGIAEPKESMMTVQKEKGKEPRNLFTRFAEDQRRLWSSPERIRLSDAEWLIPAGGFAAALFVTDRDASLHLSRDPKTINRYNDVSNAGVGALLGSAGGLWLLGHVRHDQHWSESGFLAGEAVLNSLVMVEGLKYSLGRERPFQGSGSGAFFQGGTSFPSEHAAAA
jgi:hypothetical protein